VVTSAPSSSDAYRRFLEAKVAIAPSCGFDVPDSAVNPVLKPHQRAIVRWMVAGGRRACFAAFGLGKSVIQLEAVRLVREHAGGRALIVVPLGVRQEFFHDAAMLGTEVRFIRRIEEVDRDEPIYLTNYETVRDGKLDPRHFNVASLDEAAVLRGFGGTKTFREFMRTFAGDAGRGPSEASAERARWSRGVPYRFVATAVPSPNEYIELLSYCAYLGILDVSQAKTRFFKRNSEKADHLTLHPHKVKEFWLWVASWALFVERPSDLDSSFSDEGYDLPPLEVRWHEVATDHSRAGSERDGQGRMFKNAALGVTHAAREKRDSLGARVAKLLELRAEDPAAHRILWHDLEDERRALEAAVPGVVSIYGSQDLDEREQIVRDFAEGRAAELAAKPVMLGSGTNLQRHCAWAIFLGIGFKFSDLIQAIHRLRRYLQTHPVRIDLIYTEAEREVRRALEEKWAQHVAMVGQMTALIREFGLAQASLASGLTRTMGVKRTETAGEGYRLMNGDAIEEARAIETGSVHLIITSIPFSTQYEYTPSYNDLGHTDNDDHFFEHLGFLTPELLRVLQPGRVAAVHVKDRIVPGGLTGLGFQTVSPFSDHTIAHFRRHGFAFLGRKTVVTDVVRENNQTYRLGWTEQCKDGSRMGAGLPEYVLLFRKPPSDSSNGYADVPVVKDKAKYSRTRWQIDAHGFMRSNGNRPIRAEELVDLPHDNIFPIFRRYSLTHAYDFENHVEIGEALEAKGRLPVTFMLLQPASWHPDVWADIARMRTLNMMQERKGQELHLCPLQFDIVDRLITQFSMPGELVFDPFGGLMTVPYCAIKKRRRGLGIELNPTYFADGAAYCAAASRDIAMPTLFDLTPVESETEVAPGA
jgi:hypothetical protein